MDQIHRDSIVIVAHDHRPIGPDLARMSTGGVTEKVYQVGFDVDIVAGYEVSKTRKEGWLNQAVRDMETALGEIDANREQSVLARNVSDVHKAKADDRVAIILGSEGARWLEGSLDPLGLFYRLGLRELQLTWAFPSPLISDGGLSDFGAEVVSECQRLGILIDLTHIPKPAFYQALDLAQHPFIVSHGAAQSVTKDLDDDQIGALVATGGVLGIHFYTSYLGPDPTPESVFRQIEYVGERFGVDHVALGVDFFPTDGPWRDLQIAQGTTDLRWAVEDMTGMPAITRCLLDHGWSEEDVRKVLGLNFLRVCQEVFGE